MPEDYRLVCKEIFEYASHGNLMTHLMWTSALLKIKVHKVGFCSDCI